MPCSPSLHLSIPHPSIPLFLHLSTLQPLPSPSLTSPHLRPSPLHTSVPHLSTPPSLTSPHLRPSPLHTSIPHLSTPPSLPLSGTYTTQNDSTRPPHSVWGELSVIRRGRRERGGEGEGKKGGRRGRRGKKNFVLSALTHPLALSVKPIKLLSCAWLLD